MSGVGAKLQLQRGAFELAADFALPGVGVSALFGPSGSGKSTCLRILAGLEPAAGGSLSVAGEVWHDAERKIFLPPHQRAVGMVFQDAGLFLHLSVRSNLEFGWRRLAAGERKIAFATAVEWLDLGALLDRDTAGLSGGERQRVAIARALLTSPRLLLLDEPLAALDLKRRQEILPYLERLREVLAIPVVYVSHAADEVARLADHLVVLDGGRVVAAGGLEEMLARLDLAGHFADDAGVVVETTLVAQEADELSRLEFAGGAILVARRNEALGSRLRCRIHARDVSLALAPAEHSSILNRLEVSIVELAATSVPGQMMVRLEAAGTPLLARLTARSVSTLGLHPGLQLWAQIKSVAVL